jgi:AraC family transcriptional regulator
MPLEPTITEVERLHFCSDVVAIASFRCPAEHPLFVDSGPTSGYLVVFPRTSTIVIHDKLVTAGPPTTVFYNRGQLFRRRKIDVMDAADWFMIAPDIVRDIVAQYDPGAADREENIFSFSQGPASAETYLRQRRLFIEVSAQGTVDDLHVEESAIDILESAVASAFPPHKRKAALRRSRFAHAVEAGKALIAANLSQSISLRRIAARVECSPFQFCRAFQKLTGYKVTEYRQALRLRTALHALRETSLDLSEIALDLGYSSHSHFTMFFRRHFGMTPSEYRHGGGIPVPLPPC